MIPSAENSDYPEFVADQVLTSDNLNDLFGYLDEQGRMTRTNLVGIGIVCGLKVKTAANGSITITKGVGVTSSGYLVSVPEITYTKRTTDVFDAVKCEYYDKFVTGGTPRTQRFNLWELKQDAESTGTTALTKAFLNDGEKIVLIFVELLEENNKNCDPDSCDDKGVKITVTFRPLLVSKADAATLISSAGNNITSAKFNLLPDVFLPRWNVPNTIPVTADQIITGYKSILTQNFIQSVQTALSLSYTTFQPVIADEYPSDPFAGFNLVTHFNFLYNGSINTNQSIHIQYYYDLFSDLIEAYNEFCITGGEILSTCCPDESLFPRHLLLGEAVPLALDTPSAYRHYFMYSPLFERKDLIVTLKSLFRRMDLMVKNFLIPPVTTSLSNAIDQNIKITPSKLSRAPLSEKAIPYYYTPKVLPVPLYKHWSVEKSLRNRDQQILSYNSNLYNNTDDFVKQPLKYDLEPYNFFRIEGITGKPLKVVLDTIYSTIDASRLPFQVVPVATGSPLPVTGDDECCHFSDIKLQFQLLVNELLCCLKNNIRYWGSLEKRDDGKGRVVFERPKLVKNFAGTVNREFETDKAGVKSKSAAPDTILAKENLSRTEDSTKFSVNEASLSFRKGEFITQSISEIQESSIAIQYLQYQALENIAMISLPPPRTNTAEENITYYILIIIDELEELAGFLAEKNIEDFDITGFMGHGEKLKKACDKLDKLLTAYNLTEYQVEKIRLNATAHTAAIDKIEAVMPIISDDDTNKIILLLLNLTSTTDFIAQLQKNKGNYTAQQKVITTFYNSLDKDGMMIPIIKEPDARTEYTYSSLQEHLKSGMCFCDMQNLKFLIDKYKEQIATLSNVNNFSVYTKNHPGLQHKAGVTSGGTFIIVYKGSNDPRADITSNTVIGDFYLPYSCCSDCAPVQVIIQEPQLPGNLPPVAKAGDDVSIQLPVNEVTLDGTTSTDPDGTIKAYLWEYKSGPTGSVIDDASAAKTKLSNLVQGEYVFKLTVTDDDNSSSADDVKITVLALPKVPPTANAGPDQMIVIAPVASAAVGTAQLDGSLSSDSDGTITGYSWAKISGPPSGIITSPAAVKTLATGLTQGVYEFELTVTDNDGLTGKDRVTVVVEVKSTQPPVSNAGTSKTITLPQNSVELDGSASSDPDGTIVSYSWAKTGGPTSGVINSPTAPKTIVSGLTAGTHQYELTVTDNDNLTNKSQVLVVVIQPTPTKSCAPLNDIIVQFNGLSTVDTAANFKAFGAQYDDLKEIQAFYKLMSDKGIASSPVSAQIAFFIEQKIESRLVTWIDNLGVIIQESTNLRVLALTMLNIHAQLAYYIACIQSEDINKAEVKMAASIQSILKILAMIQSMVANFTQAQRNVLAKLLDITKAELNRVTNNGEQTKKPQYFEMLSRIIEILDSMNL